MTDVIRVMLVDDHAVLRAGIRALLEDEADITVVAEADTGEQALERLKQAKPDVVVMDLDMPGMGGLEATRRIATMEDGPRVLILTLHAEDDFLLPVLEAATSPSAAPTRTSSAPSAPCTAARSSSIPPPPSSSSRSTRRVTSTARSSS
jgi:DNA-binding NarL/FixJ family response regulator